MPLRMLKTIDGYENEHWHVREELLSDGSKTYGVHSRHFDMEWECTDQSQAKDVYKKVSQFNPILAIDEDIHSSD